MTGDDSPSGDRPVVLAVDDEARVVQAFELWLGDDYRFETATSGREALEQMHSGIDVVLLDRHMPGLSGAEVLDSIREDGYDCQVAMVTAVDPDFDIVEMPFDHYVSKPVDETELREVIEELLGLDGYGQTVHELYSVTQKIATLEAEKPRQTLEKDERYQELIERREELQQQADDFVTGRSTAEFEDLFEHHL